MTELAPHDEWVDDGNCDAVDDDGSWCALRVDHDGIHQPLRVGESDRLQA